MDAESSSSDTKYREQRKKKGYEISTITFSALFFHYSK